MVIFAGIPHVKDIFAACLFPLYTPISVVNQQRVTKTNFLMTFGLNLVTVCIECIGASNQSQKTKIHRTQLTYLTDLFVSKEVNSLLNPPL
jgi:hypothetical protein